MERIKQAIVKWHQFGNYSKGVFGENFEDAGDRLAIISCPWCGHRRSLEYFEYMQLLRMNAIACAGCSEHYSLRPISSQRPNAERKNDTTKDNTHHEEGVSPPTEDPDDFGRRDWGLA